jgi:hypothetical protein
MSVNGNIKKICIPFVLQRKKNAIGIFIGVCVLFAVTAMEYHGTSGYRLKKSIPAQFLRFVLFAALLTLAAVGAWHLLPFKWV